MVNRKARLTSALVSIVMILAMMASIMIPMGAETYPSVTTVTAEATGTDYSIANATEWMYVFNNYSWFNKNTVTLHLAGTVDFGGATTFTGFKNPMFSFDGHGNTVKNWGAFTAKATSNGMFWTGNGNASGMKFIRNVTLENCYTRAFDAYATGLVYAVSHNNAADGDRPTEFTMENVHVKNCGHDAVGGNEVHAILLTRYANKGADTTVTMRNCSVIGTTLDLANATNHNGFALGKPRADSGTATAVYNITDLVLIGNTMVSANEKSGLITGTVENGTATVNVKNAIVAGNTIFGKNDVVGLAACTSNGVFNIQDSAFSGNTVSAATAVYLVSGSGSTSAGLNAMSNVYLGDSINGYAEANAGAFSAVTDAAKMGEMAYSVNKGSYAVKWAVENGKIVPASETAPAPVKVTLVCQGAPDEYLYLTPGAVQTLAYAEGASYAMQGEAEGYALNGDKLTVGAADATVAVSLAGLNLEPLEKAVAQYNGLNLAYYASSTGVALADLIAEVTEKMASEDFADQAEISAYVEKLGAYAYASYPNVPSATEIGKYSDSKNFVVKTLGDLEYVANNAAAYAGDVTVHLGADITVTAGSAANRMTNFVAKLDGHGYAIKNVSFNGNKVNYSAWIDIYNGTYIGNLVLEGWTGTDLGWKGSMLIGYATGASALTIENITVKNCAIDKASNYGSFTIGDCDDAALTLRNITIENNTFTRNTGTGNSGLLLGRYSNGNGTLTVDNITLNGNVLDGNFTTELGNGSSGAGAVIGELTAKTATVKNVIYTNPVYGESYVANGVLFGRVKNASPVVDNVVIEVGAWAEKVPVVRLQKTDNKYDANNAATVTLNNVYSDAAYLAYGDTSSVGANTTVADINSGKLAYELNEKGLSYVMNEKGLSFGSEGKPVQVTLVVEENIIATLYTDVNGKLLGLTDEMIAAADWGVDLAAATFTQDETVTGILDPEFVVEDASGKNGETVSVPVSIKNNPGFVGAEVKVTYDANALTLVGLAKGDFDVFAEVGDPVVEEGVATVEIVLVAMNGDMPADVIEDGVIGELQFKINDAAAPAAYDVTVSAIEVVNFNEDVIVVEDGAGKVTVSCNMVLVPADNTTAPEEAAHYYACSCGITQGRELCSASEGWTYEKNDATCTATGSVTAACAVCGYSYSETLDIIDHDLTYFAPNEATCEEDGNVEYWYCEVCEKYFADADATEEITEDDTVDPATDHDYPDTWTNVAGTDTHTKVCANGCGEDLVENCTFGEWVQDGEEMVKTCVCGNEKRKPVASTTIVGEALETDLGDVLALVLSAEDVSNLAGLNLVVTYDSAALDLVDYEVEGFADIGPAVQVEGTVVSRKVALVLNEALTEDGEVITLFFDTLASGNHAVQIEGVGASYDLGEYDLIGYEGTVSVVEPIVEYVRGDINGDGRVSISDAVMMMRVAAGDAEVLALADLEAGNVTTEGDTDEMVINTNDIIMVLQYLNKTIDEL